MAWKSSLGSIEWQAFVLILLAAAPVMLPVLDNFFTFDDMMNLDYYDDRPWVSLYSNLLVFTSFHRPLGALFYLPLYQLWGMDPFPFYLTGLLLVAINLGLAYSLTLRLSGSLAVAVGAATAVALHPYIRTITFNFGSIYEQACMLGLLAGMHCYMSATSRLRGDPKRKWWYAGTWLCYWIALNAKETGVVLPAMLLAYELIYRFLWHRPRPGWAGLAKRLTPMFAVAAIYTVAKVLGEEAYWRTNPLYEYHFDLTILKNLASYVTLTSYQNFRFDAAEIVVLLAVLTAAGVALRNRHVLFGLAAALLAFLPVLPLPRVWTLFLYIPSFGMALCFFALAVDLLRRIAKRAAPARWMEWRPGHVFQLILVAAFAGTALQQNVGHFEEALEFESARRIDPWRSFAHQLWDRYPDFEDQTVVGIENPPFNPDGFDKWCPYFLVRLRYPDRNVQVYYLPQQEEEFLWASTVAPQAIRLAWENGKLMVKDF